jgi:hypothetical protein
VITAYAIATVDRLPPGAEGIGGAPIELVRLRSLVAAVSRHPGAPAPSPDAIIAHAAVCDDLMAVADAVLPVRFGATFDDDAPLLASLEQRYDHLVAGLDHVRGRVEVGVRVRWDEAPGPVPPRPPRDRVDSGRAYLMRRVAQERRRQQAEDRAEGLAAGIHRLISACAVDHRLQVMPTDGLVMSGAYLVDRGDLSRMVDGVRAVARDHPELELLCTGPWPPYNFSEPEVSRARSSAP